MNNKTLIPLIDHPPQPGHVRFVIGLDNSVLAITRRIAELFTSYVPHNSIVTLEREISQAAGTIATATVIQLLAGIHMRPVGDHIVMDLICAELTQAFYSLGTFDRIFLMGLASDLQHCGQMAGSEALIEFIPEIDNRAYCTVMGYRAHPGPVPYITVDLSITGSLTL